MHHTYFWEEFIDKGGRLCGWVVNISHPISDLVGQSRPCAIVCVEVNESVWVMCKPKRVSCCVRDSACGTCVGVCVSVCVGEQHSYPSKSPAGRPLPQEKNEPCPTDSAYCCSSPPATISSWFTLSGCELERHTPPPAAMLHSQQWHRKLTHSARMHVNVLIQIVLGRMLPIRSVYDLWLKNVCLTHPLGSTKITKQITPNYLIPGATNITFDHGKKI